MNLQTASQTNAYSDLIEYTFIPIRSGLVASDELLTAVDKRFPGNTGCDYFSGFPSGLWFPPDSE
ncbi:hypothetical protein [uncultured Methanolobus sp.]|uniref:hypothetical protein n=1 Tax=uncultured Methanolobus sp. TaxID=218300 RepID=UPI002AAA83BD|nr:hypothetical protein [uncultured Methanolobus sp.]